MSPEELTDLIKSSTGMQAQPGKRGPVVELAAIAIVAMTAVAIVTIVLQAV